MKLKAFVFLIFILGSLGSWATNSLELKAAKLQSLSAKPTNLKSEFKGQVLLLDLWASWCEPCKESLPFYEELQKRYGDKGLQVIAVSVDDNLKAANEFADKNKLKLQLLWDPKKELVKLLDVKAIPTMLLIDQNGKVLFRERGFLKNTKENIEKSIPQFLK